MAGQASPYYPRRKDFQILGLNRIMKDKTGQILHEVLLWGTPRWQTGQLFSEYLISTKGMPENELRKRFNKSQQEKMENDPQMNSADVSLLYQCLKFGTDGLAPPNDAKWIDMNSLEGLLTRAKNYRNALVHGDYVIDDQLYLDKIEEIRNLLTDIINEAARRFGRDQSEVSPLLKDFNEELNQIRDLPFNISASSLVFEELCTLLKIEGRIELEQKYQRLSSLSPASNLLGEEIVVQVKQIFTKIEIDRVKDKELLAVDRLFEFIDSLSSRKNLLLVEGVAGAGKTTLIRKILQEWSERSSKMKNLDSYDLAFWTECRDGGTPSLAHLLHSLMPIATKKIQGDAQVVKCIQDNALLFLVDGLDELNVSSEQVFKEILALENTDVITVICTTRPNKVPDIKKYVPNTFEILHVNIIGIAEQDREDFIRNYSIALERFVGGTIDITGLIQYLQSNESRLQEHWRLPFNLVLVTILWFLKKDIVNEMTTSTELFVQTYELCKERLFQRLHDNEVTSRLSSNEIRENLTLFVKVMAKIAFTSHCNDETVLSQTSVHQLKEACRHKALPPKEVMSSFLVQAVSLLGKDQEKFSFPHKGLQDFFCALHIEQTLEHEDTNMNIPRILSSIDEILIENMVPGVMIPSVLQACKSKLGNIQGETFSTGHTMKSVFEKALERVTVTEHKQDPQIGSQNREKVLFRLKRFFTRRERSLTHENSANPALEYDLRKWRNILVHLTGLLHHRGRSLTDERAEEMVKLLEESGITDSDEWFDFLSNVKCDAAISKHILLEGGIKVSDARVEAFLKVLNQAVPEHVFLEIKGNPSTAPGLKELLVALREKNWNVWLYLDHDFQFPKEGGSILDGTLLELFRSNLRLDEFKGQLSASALKELPSSVYCLFLSVKDGAHFRSLLPTLTSWAEKKKGKLSRLYIHVPVDIDESSLRPLPSGLDVLRLFVSDVGEATVEKASVVARALQPSEGRYEFLCFPGVGRTTTDCERLVHQLSQRGVEVEYGVFVSPEMDEGERQRMKDFTRRMLKCGFMTRSDDDIWKLIGLLY